ncbi:hypothetical protein [Streptomyces acidiscabies]|uniref:Uncharacterized protein n=1 Tax=Streptomyces acidiscabies TaxID=42234 RepID=A0ABU4MFQ5_9ACTN|nr:hypothetical protein [Streptomyces acidiscabies]MDX3025950.1 hypothetical protein [Streptomyces acidiscabies]
MDKPMPITRRLARAALFGLVNGAAWAAGSHSVAVLAWLVQHR